jgi:ubiquinone/menaquinone biosynthesis C-methylase UbiE
MSLLVPPRRPSRELLDDPALPGEEMRRSLEDIDLAHRRWGAARALVRHLAPRVRALGRPARILDVGAGSGTVSERLGRSLAAEGARVRLIALDLQWRHLAAGRSLCLLARPPAVGADAFRLPFRDGAFDFAISTLFLHHFSPHENRALLSEFLRVARQGFAVLDLRRHLVPTLVLEVAGRIFFRAHVSIRDGVASLRQAYTRAEAAALAREASPSGRAVDVFPFGMLVTGGP